MSKKYTASSKSATTKPKKTTERSPAIQFYFRQFLGDEQVASMDLETTGAHILLMCYAGASESGYRLAYIRHKIARLLRMSCDEKFDQILDNLLAGAWKISDCGNYIEQEGLKRSFEKQKQFSTLQSERAKKRWENKDENPASIRHMPAASVRHMPSSSSSSTSTIDLNTKVLRSKNTHSDVVCFEGGSGETFVELPAPVEPANPDDVKVSGKLFPEIYLSANERKKIKTNYANDGLGDEAVTLGLETLQHYAINHSAKFKKYKSHYLVMIGWVKVEVKKKIKQDLDLSRSQIYATKAQISQFTN